MSRTGWLLLFCAVLLTAACELNSVVVTPGDAVLGEDGAVIYVTSDGWHSEIVVSRANLPLGAIPEAADFPDASYLSLGWGDAEYFPARNPTFAMALRAAFQPTSSVIHMVGLRSHPRDMFPADEVVELRISTHGLGNLVAYLDETFARDGATRAQSIAAGLYSFSRFYRAEGEFHFFNTCNAWTARGLKAAGWPIRASGVVSAEDLMAQVRLLAGR